MKTNLLFASLLLAGCQSSPPVIRPLPDPLPMHASPASLAAQPVGDAPAPKAPVAAAPAAADTEKQKRQAQWIEALMAQNDVLTARLGALDQARTSPPPATPLAPAAAGATAPAPGTALPVTTAIPETASVPAAGAVTPAAIPDTTPLLVPNADGVVDTTALKASGSPPNPFAVRSLPADAVREVSFKVEGIFAGAVPCVLVNGRVAEPGDSVESLKLTRITAEALVLTGEGFAVRLPLGLTKVRLAL